MGPAAPGTRSGPAGACSWADTALMDRENSMGLSGQPCFTPEVGCMGAVRLSGLYTSCKVPACSRGGAHPHGAAGPARGRHN